MLFCIYGNSGLFINNIRLFLVYSTPVDTEVYGKILLSKKEYWAGDGMQSKCWPVSNHSCGWTTRQDYIDAKINKSCNGM